jgi:hypothetical protein
MITSEANGRYDLDPFALSRIAAESAEGAAGCLAASSSVAAGASSDAPQAGTFVPGSRSRQSSFMSALGLQGRPGMVYI